MTWAEFAREMESIFKNWEIHSYGGESKDGNQVVKIELRRRVCDNEHAGVLLADEIPEAV